MQKKVLVDKLNEIYVDYKSTTILAELVSNQAADINDLLVKRVSAEQRYVRSDVNVVEYFEDESGDESIIVEVNREGLYDILPETLFHQKLISDRNEDAQTKFKRHRKEESDARNFFYPIENEFDKRSLYFELMERQLNNQHGGVQNQDLFDYFFEPNAYLNPSQRLILLYILPLANKIRGQIERIEILLSRLFAKKIQVDVISSSRLTDQDDEVKEKRLAVNFILGNKALEVYDRYVVRFFDLSVEEYYGFREGKPNAILLHYIIKYLFPLHAEIKVQFHHAKLENAPHSEEKNEILILDFNSYI